MTNNVTPKSALDELAEAIRQYDVKEVRALLKQGVDVNGISGDGNTPLIQAVRSMYCGSSLRATLRLIIDLLIEAGADPHKKDNEGYDVYNVKALYSERLRDRFEYEDIKRMEKTLVEAPERQRCIVEAQADTIAAQKQRRLNAARKPVILRRAQL